MVSPAVKVKTKPSVRCQCGHLIFDGEVVKGRIVRLVGCDAQAKCAKCKDWVDIPLRYMNTTS